MMDWFPSWTQCSTPGGWYKVPVAAMLLFAGIGLTALIAAGVAGAWAPGVAAFLASVCLAGITVCTWWLNIRLICLGGDRSAVGAIFHLEPPDPSPSSTAFDFGKYDTDYSFNLLLWQFTPQDQLPASFVNSEWSPAAVGQLATDWPTLPPQVPGVPWATVKDEVDLIVPQQTMASLNLKFVGQDDGSAIQRFLIHCEIEGPGVHDLRTFLWVLFGVFVAAAALSAIPVIGTALAFLLAFLAFIAFLVGGKGIQGEGASPPSGGGFGGTFHSYDECGNNPDCEVDLAYVFGRWVYDSFHDGWNELHPLHFMLKINEPDPVTKGDIDKGNWPSDLGDVKSRYDKFYAGINDPSTPATQAEPQNQWTVHPLLDGCQGAIPYPEPQQKPVIT